MIDELARRLDAGETIFVKSHRRPSFRTRNVPKVKEFFRLFGLVIGLSVMAAWTLMSLTLVVFGWPGDWFN